MKNSSRRNRTFLISILVAVVILPGVALSLLALRAAERESMYVERRMESALLAETDLAARRVESLMNDVFEELVRAMSGGDRIKWRSSALVSVAFVLDGDTFETLDMPSEHDAGTPQSFSWNFAPFLVGGVRIPVYEGISGVYRREMAYESEKLSSSSPLEMRKKSEVPLTQDSAAMHAAPAPPSPAPMQESVVSFEPPAAEEKIQAFDKLDELDELHEPKEVAKSGIAMQRAISGIAASPAIREDAYRQAEEEGFEIAQRNVAPQAQNIAPGALDERSGFVSRGRTFAEISSGVSGGLLPRLTDDGLEILFWMKKSGKIVGCTIDMDVLRDRIAGAIPEMLNELRILTVLDETGSPIVAPETESAPDWRRPFVAREISSELPRWEVGAWLVDPGLMTSRAEYAQRTVWVLVAAFFVLLVIGSLALIRAVFAEMRIARQKTTFVANVSHELKTPLTSIRLFAELLLSGRQSDEAKRVEYLRTMVSETERLSNLVDNVLAFSRRDGGNDKKFRMEPLMLGEITRDTCAQMEPYLKRRGFALKLECTDNLPVQGDREALRQVLMNIMSNAEKYSGDVREIDILCGSRDSTAFVAVADRGVGVTKKAARKIFNEFYRADDSLSAMRSGAGLGLSIARGIARVHGGDVTYEPRRGGGSIFKLTLPLAASETEAKA